MYARESGERRQVRVGMFMMRPWREGNAEAEGYQGWLGRARPRDEGFGEDILEDASAEEEFLSDLGIKVDDEPGPDFVLEKQYALGPRLQFTRLRGARYGLLTYRHLAGSIGRSTSEESAEATSGSDANTGHE